MSGVVVLQNDDVHDVHVLEDTSENMALVYAGNALERLQWIWVLKNMREKK